MNGKSSNDLSCPEQLTVHLPSLQEKPTSVATRVSSEYSHSRPICIQDEVADVFENKRMCNLIIHNLPPSSINDAVRLGTLFESITGKPTQYFHAESIGKASAEKSKPILVRFLSEHNCRNILRHAYKLRYMQAEYPHVGIAPDRTKKEQECFRYHRNECSERQAKGERVIIINGLITLDKRPPKDNPVDRPSSVAPILPQNISNKTVNQILGKLQYSCLTKTVYTLMLVAYNINLLHYIHCWMVLCII